MPFNVSRAVKTMERYERRYSRTQALGQDNRVVRSWKSGPDERGDFQQYLMSEVGQSGNW